MERADWQSRWEAGQTPFHQTSVTPVLDRYAHEVFGSHIARVLVPLCGKSLDMVVLADLADLADEVVGVEYVEHAVREFFDERDLTPDVTPGAAKRFSGGKYVLFAADFFGVQPADIGPVDAVFDRAALVALDGPTRVRYADHLAALVEPGATMLLVTLDYDQSMMGGPPFAVSSDEVQRLFSAGFDVEHLETRGALDGDFQSRGLTSMTQSAHRLTRR